jgi:ferrous iron transport protein B
MSLTIPSPRLITYGHSIETELDTLASELVSIPAVADRFAVRWLAVQLLEGEAGLLDQLAPAERAAVEAFVEASHTRLRPEYGDDFDIAIADARYRFARALVAQATTVPATPRTSLSERIDRVVTHRVLGIPIFLALMYLVFSLVQRVAAPYVDWVDSIFAGPLTRWALGALTFARAPSWLVSLVTEGLIAGVGGVLVFLPGLLVLYFALAVLEDSGYLARATFVMDRAISALGLHGKSFIPLILGFGCNVPAIYATRTIESRPARVLTGLLIPFMSCSARLPVYVVFGLAFFPQQADAVIWGMYVVGVVVAALVGAVLSRTLFRGAERGAFLLELPPYRLPMPGALLRRTWHHAARFVRKAGTVILAASTVLWLLLHLPLDARSPRESLFGQVGASLAPVFAPAGFGDWRAAGSLLSGVMAKELVVATMAQTYGISADGGAAADASSTLADDVEGIVTGLGAATLRAGQELLEIATPGMTLFVDPLVPQETALSAVLRTAFTPLSALAFLLFVLLYVPCVATVSAQLQELGWRWTTLAVAITLVVPWTVATLVYQIGRLLGGA